MYIIIVIENTVDWHIETYQGILKCNKKLKTLAVNKLKGFFFHFVCRHVSCPDRIEVDKIRWMIMKYVKTITWMP